MMGPVGRLNGLISPSGVTGGLRFGAWLRKALSLAGVSGLSSDALHAQIASCSTFWIRLSRFALFCGTHPAAKAEHL